MEAVRRVPKTDLARRTRQVLSAVQRGQTVIVENHGEPEAAIIDIVDFRIVRAVMRYHARPPKIDVEAGLSDEQVQTLPDPQALYDLALAHYLAGSISLARVAELLGLSWVDLRARCVRTDVPVRTGPVDLAEARQDVEAAERWLQTHEP